MDTRPAAALTEGWDRLPDRPVRSLVAGDRSALPELVVVPGLGALGYLLPMVRACSAWTRVRLLDLPGFGHALTARSPSSLAAVSATVAQWLLTVAPRPVVLAGHSTGAQAALRAAAAAPDRVVGVALLGPTFPPEARRWLPLSRRALATALRERPGEVPAVLPDYLRSRGRFLTLLRTSMSDEPDRLASGLSRPLLVMRGRHDHLCPERWAQELGRGEAVTVGGAHNFPFSHPDEPSELLRRFATAAAAD